MKPDPSTPKRTIAKAISWESFSNLVCFGLAYATFGNVGGCAVFTGICSLVKLILFYYHERIWHQIPFGKQACAGEGGQRGFGSSWPRVAIKGAWSTGDYTGDTETRSTRLWKVWRTT